MDNIFERQNEESLMKLQFSQRRHYDAAGRWNRSLWVIAILLALIGNNVLFEFQESGIQLVLVASLTIAAFFINSYVNKLISIGSNTKELFDRMLFGLDIYRVNWDIDITEIKEIAERLKDKHQEKFRVALMNTGQDKPKGLRNWYTSSIESTQNKTIFGCQKENIWWDKKLTDLYRMVLITITFIALGGFVYKFYNSNLSDIINSLMANLTLVLKLIDDYRIQKKYSEHQISIKILEGIISRKEEPSISDLVDFQDLIFARRCMRYLPFDSLHTISSVKLHKLWKSISQFDK